MELWIINSLFSLDDKKEQNHDEDPDFATFLKPAAQRMKYAKILMTRDNSNPLQKSGLGASDAPVGQINSISAGGEDAGLFNQKERFSQDIFHKGFNSTHNEEQ